MQNYKFQRGKFGFVSKFFTDGFNIALKTVNTKHLMLRNSVNCKLTRMGNHEFLQKNREITVVLFCVFPRLVSKMFSKNLTQPYKQN